MLFKWRRDLRAGLLDGGAHAPATLLPVTLPALPVRQKRPAPAPSTSDVMIEIVIADALVRVPGGVDSALLKSVIESLRA